jgi:DNA-binding CsgD family transcriptional regulator
MASSGRLRVDEVRRAYRLLGECRDLGSDPALWQPRMMQGLSQLFGAALACGGEGRLRAADGSIDPLTYFDSGFDAANRHNYLAYMRADGPMGDPFIQALRRRPGAPLTRRQVVSDAVYFRAEVVDRYLRPVNVHHRLATLFTNSDRSLFLLHVYRQRGERDFSSRDRALLGLFHHELAPLVGRALVGAAEATPMTLSPRLRQTLACLVEGDSEKQVAARLGMSHATAHQYVTALYRRFGVNSRGQLLAHVLKRSTRPEWRDGLRV